MWILKGSLLGIVMFSILFAFLPTLRPDGSAMTLTAFRYRSSFYHVLIGPGVISQITTHNVLFWLGLVGCVLLGCAIVGSWPIKGFFWTP